MDREKRLRIIKNAIDSLEAQGLHAKILADLRKWEKGEAGEPEGDDLDG